MSTARRFLAIIPARAGSKRVPGKNKRDFQGKPLIAWTIEAALSSQLMSEVVVSTDDCEIAKIAASYGAKVPFIRPDELCTDTAKTSDCVMHALNFYAEQQVCFDYIVLLQPTSPLRSVKHIQQAIALLDENKADAVVSFCEVEHSPLWCKTLPNDLSIGHFAADPNLQRRSQDLDTHYRPNGSIYVIKTDVFINSNSFYIEESGYAYIMSKEDSVDIDTELDFMIANAVYESKFFLKGE